MRLLRIFAIILAPVAVGAVAIILLADWRPRTPKQRNSTAIRFLLDGTFAAKFAGEMIADREGYFPRRVQLSSFPDSTDFAASVAREHAIGVTSGRKFLLGAWRRIPVTAFAASFLDTSVAIYTLENSGLQRPADLVGKRVGYRTSGEGEAIFDAMLAQLGIPRSQITKVPERNGTDALRGNEVDAIVRTIGDIPQFGRPDYVPLQIIRPQDFGIHVPDLVYFASTELIQDQPSLVAEVLKGLVRGWKFAYADYARSVPILVQYDSAALDPDRVRFELQQQRSLVLPTGGRICDYDESRWRTLRDILLFAKLGEEQVPLAQVVNYQLLRDVYRAARDLDVPPAPEAGINNR